ncbi:MAG TPA: DUF5131 family protein [Bryobacteraceae bacterium]|nr:DUF5131 family protein [Bryobacteraceae bacterium]
MSFTPIEWTHPPGFEGETWNPTLGCSKRSPGCKHCYAIRSVWRMAHHPNAKIAAANAGLVVLDSGGALNWSGRVNAIEERLEIPLRRHRPTCWFVNSLSDLFHPQVPAEFIFRVFDVMRACPWHRFIILTKHAGRMYELLVDSEPIPGVCLGVSAENQKWWDVRVPFLRATPAWRRVVSCEPLLGHIGISGSDVEPKIHQIIWGGESGAGARACELAWIRSGIEQCRRLRIAAFVKQFGSHPTIGGTPTFLRSRKGGEPSEWPEDCRVREYPHV